VRKLQLVVIALITTACGSDIGPEPGPASLVIENNSQYVLHEIRMHETESYADAPKLNVEPLEIGVSLVHHETGTFFVTVMREKFAGGEDVALTTQFPIQLLGDNGYRLQVFDQSFRLDPAPLIKTSSTSTTAR